jgi:hypothetical protein
VSETTDPTGSTAGESVDPGRYLYCLVDLGEEGQADTVEVDVDGIEGEPVFVITAHHSTVGALVHERRAPFDSTDLAKLRDWLLGHQQVVDAAGDRFGTPLPVRFDTVLDGDDEAVATWLDRNAGQIADAFDKLDGCWEYRVTLSWDSTGFEAEQRRTDTELSRIDERLDRSGTGTQFLLEKKYDQRVRELVRQRETALKGRLVDGLRADARELTERPVQSDAAASLGVELDSEAIAQVALLASPDAESAIGSTLDEVADIGGVDVRFTGPWPPYTFAPEITDDG